MPKDQSANARPKFLVRVAVSVLFGFVFLGAIYMEITVVRNAWRATTTFAWREVPAIMLESSAQVAPALNMEHTLHVRYRYIFDGVVREGRNYGWAGAPHRTDFAFDIAKEIPVGATVRCFVNPKNPAEATLERGSLFGWVLVLFPPLVAYAAARALVEIWR